MKTEIAFSKKGLIFVAAMLVSAGLVAQPFEDEDDVSFDVNLSIPQLFLISKLTAGDVDLTFDGINDETGEVEFCIYTNGTAVSLTVESANGSATTPRLYDGVGEYVDYAIALENATPAAVSFDSSVWNVGAVVNSLSGAGITDTLNAGDCDTMTLTLEVEVLAADMAVATVADYSDTVTLTIEPAI
jgi:hypothetical protein